MPLRAIIIWGVYLVSLLSGSLQGAALALSILLISLWAGWV